MNATNLTKKIFDALNKNGAELGSASIPIIEQVLESNPIPATEREKQIVEAFIRSYFDDTFLVDNDWNFQWEGFTKTIAYRSIPPALPDYQLESCEVCNQLTNHLNGVCQKCKGQHETTIASIDKITERLVKLYKDDPLCVAKMCDEVLDRSGALLGKIRELAKEQLLKNEDKVCGSDCYYPEKQSCAECQHKCPLCGKRLYEKYSHESVMYLYCNHCHSRFSKTL